MSLLLLFAPRASATPAPEPQPQPAGLSAAAILRDAYREQRIKQDDRDLAVIVPAVLQPPARAAAMRRAVAWTTT